MLVCLRPILYPKGVSRRAVLIFAEEAHVELARRGLPTAARPLLNLPSFDSELSRGIDVHLFSSGRGAIPDESRIHRQVGRGFTARLENAIEKIHELGYDEVVVIGRDCPSLRPIDIENAFAALGTRKLVLGPDHRGGCYLIAFRLCDRGILRRIRWKHHTDCAELCERCLPAEVYLLPLKHELDSWADIRLFAHTNELLACLAAFVLRTIALAQIRVVQFVSIVSQRMRVRQQMPPPAFVS